MGLKRPKPASLIITGRPYKAQAARGMLLTPQTEIDTKTGHVGFVVDEVAMNMFSPSTSVYLTGVIPPMLPTH